MAVEGALLLQESYRRLIHKVDVSNTLVIRESSGKFTHKSKSEGVTFHSFSVTIELEASY